MSQRHTDALRRRWADPAYRARQTEANRRLAAALRAAFAADPSRRGDATFCVSPRAIYRARQAPGEEGTGMSYLLWYDDSKGTTESKIHAAIAAYRDRFHEDATVVLTNADELVSIVGMVIESRGYIRLNNYWVGREEMT